MENISDLVKQFETDTGKHVLAVYQSGAALNGLALRENSDYDFIVFVEDDPKDVLNNQSYSKQFHEWMPKVDLKVYDLRRLYQLLQKSNFNMLEIFSKKPIYCDCGLFEHLDFKVLASLNLKSFCKSIMGMTKTLQKQLKHATNFDDKDLIKKLVQAFKAQLYLRNIYDYLTKDYKAFDPYVGNYLILPEINLFELKASAYTHQLSEDELQACYQELLKLVNDNQQYDDYLCKHAGDLHLPDQSLTTDFTKSLVQILQKSL